MSVPYAYFCIDHGEFSRRYHLGTAPRTSACPQCGEFAKRLLGCPYVSFKGKGWTRGQIDPFRHKDGTKLTESDKNRVPAHLERS